MSKKENHVSKIYIRGLGLVETSPEHKKDYENECARIRMKMQYHGECHVTKANINRCDGICVGCPFRSAGKFVSIHDTVQTDSALTYADVLPASEAYSPEGVLARKTLREELSRIFAGLTDEERQIIRLVVAGQSERDMAEILGIKRTTLNYRKRQLFARLKSWHPELRDLLLDLISYS